MRQAESDGEHIWLRQSVTFTTNGQTRTVEIAIPLRPGATADEVEALLSEADAGMERLARHLDVRVATTLGSAPDAPMPPPSVPASTSPAATAEPGPTSAPAEPAAAHPPAPEATPITTPAVSRVTDSPAPRERPAHSPAAAAPPARSPAPRTVPASAGASASASAPSADISRPEFLAAARDLGMDARQVMQRLGVRTLEGLNLREALEALRRQHIQEAGGEADGLEPADAVPSATSRAGRPDSASPSAPVSTRTPAPIQVPRGFDEEDEPEFTITVDDAESFQDDDLAYAGGGLPHTSDGLSEDELDELDEVPDFAPPASRATARTAQGRGSAATPTPAPAHATRSGTETGATLLARLREATGGGVASAQQRNAYRNMIVEELGETKAASLVRGIWRVPPERLGPDQMAELLSWGKHDTFGDEVALVLAELRAERDRAQSAVQPSSGPGAPRQASSSSTSASRQRGAARPADRAGGA